jgi:hypothetical protein
MLAQKKQKTLELHNFTECSCIGGCWFTLAPGIVVLTHNHSSPWNEFMYIKVQQSSHSNIDLIFPFVFASYFLGAEL